MKPTEKQLDFIKTIENYLSCYGVEFKGSTKVEATAFISEHIEDFKEEQFKQDTITMVQYEEYGFI